MSLQVVVFNISTPGNIIKALTGDADVGTLVSSKLDPESQKLPWDKAWQAGKSSEDLVKQ